MHPEYWTTYAAARTHTLPHAAVRPIYRGRALRTAMQDKRIPLHNAAMNGAPFDVMKLLLDANLEATTSRDKACR